MTTVIVSVASADYGDCYIDEETGHKHCKDVIRGPIRETGNVLDTTFGTIFTGKTPKERQEERDQRAIEREEIRRAREIND